MTKVLTKIKNLLLYAGLEKNEYNKIQDIYIAHNWMLLNFFSLAVTILMFGFSVLSFADYELAQSRPAYIVCLFACLIIFLINLLHAKNSPSTQRVMQYVFVACVYLMALFNGTISDPDNLAITFIAVIVMMPLVFNGQPLISLGSMLTASTLFIVMVLIFKNPAVQVTDIVDVLAFSFVSITIYLPLIYTRAHGYLAQWNAIDAHKDLNIAYSDLRENYSVLESIANTFYSMHEINLVEDTFEEFSASENIKKVENVDLGARDMMKRVISATVDENYLQDAYVFTDLATVADRMNGKNVLVSQFFGKNIGWFLAQFIVIESAPDGRPTKVIFTTQSNDEQKKHEQKLVLTSQTDELTSFYNRRAYEEELKDTEGITSAPNFIYISLDVNGLKIVNDNLGHAAGDELIIGACNCMRRALGSYGKLYRTGGDEFVALLYLDSGKIQSVLDDFEETTASWSGNLVDSLTVSYGYVAREEEPSMSIEEIAVLADKRMYEAKSRHYQKSGKDRKGQSNAHVELCASYTKILKINITDDTYQIVGMNAEENAPDKGIADQISVWLKDFATKGNVHPDDFDYYLTHTSLDYLSDYFMTSPRLFLFYRRKYGSGFRKCIMEIARTSDYTNDEQYLYLYVKDVDN